jgi:hypothetical protein
VNVPRWDFQKVVISYLLDPILFGNRDNLVSTDNPWEKFDIANPKESKEYLASNHYSQSFDECMDDVDDGCVREQFFFPIEIYVNGRSNFLLWGTSSHVYSAANKFQA